MAILFCLFLASWGIPRTRNCLVPGVYTDNQLNGEEEEENDKTSPMGVMNLLRGFGWITG